MPLLQDAENLPSQCSEKYLVVHDADISAFSGDESDTIVMPPYAVREGLICARQKAIAEKLNEFNDPTYQELEKRVGQMTNTSLEDVSEILRLRDCLGELEEAQLEVVAALNGQLDTVNKQWENCKAHSKRVEQRFLRLTNSVGDPLYLREFNHLQYLVAMPWYKRLWAVFVGFGGERC